MKLKVLLTILVFVGFSQNLFAEENELSVEEQYTMMCGDMPTLKAYAKSMGQRITKKDISELNESRKPILTVLKSGAKGIQALLDEGSATDTGPFGAILACSVIFQVEKQIKENGCTDLTTGKKVMDKGGVAACAKLVKSLEK